jgi:MYXO-CTERM domain-containing protein
VPIIVPQQQAAPPPATVTLPTTEPYPNGFADPTVAYGNDMSVAVREDDDGFDWGLLGLLGLLGLFGLYRGRDNYRRTVHSERYDDGRVPVRERTVERDVDR